MSGTLCAMTPLSLDEVVRRQKCRAEAAARLSEAALSGVRQPRDHATGPRTRRLGVRFWQTLALESELARAILAGADDDDATELAGRVLTHLELRKAMAEDPIERLAIEVATCELRLDLWSWRDASEPCPPPPTPVPGAMP